MKKKILISTSFVTLILMIFLFVANGSSNQLKRTIPNVATTGGQDSEKVTTVPTMVSQSINNSDVNRLPGSAEIVSGVTSGDAYLGYIDDANAGSARAQYHISEILTWCSRAPNPDDTQAAQRFEEMLIDARATPEVIRSSLEERRVMMEDCRGVYEQLPNQNLRELADAWLVTSADNGHPVAALKSLYQDLNSSFTDQYESHARDLLYESFSYIQEDPSASKDVYYSALKFYNEFLEPELYPNHNESNGSTEAIAWQYLYCASYNKCDEEAYIAEIGPYYYEYQLDEILKTADEYTKAISENDWDRLGL